jgi:hypothetical protein
LQHWHKVTSSSHIISCKHENRNPLHCACTQSQCARPHPRSRGSAAPRHGGASGATATSRGGIRERRDGTVPWACPGAGAVPSGLRFPAEQQLQRPSFVASGDVGARVTSGRGGAAAHARPHPAVVRPAADFSHDIRRLNRSIAKMFLYKHKLQSCHVLICNNQELTRSSKKMKFDYFSFFCLLTLLQVFFFFFDFSPCPSLNYLNFTFKTYINRFFSRPRACCTCTSLVNIQ